MTPKLPCVCTPAELKQARESVALARAGLRNSSPGLTKAIYEATFVLTTSVKTMAMSDRGVLMANPHYINSRPNNGAVQTSIEHELWHWLRDHAGRTKAMIALNPSITPFETNVAGDDEINDDLLPRKSFGADMDEKVMHPRKIGAPVGLTMEEYVVLHREHAAKQQPPQKPPPSTGGDNKDESDGGEDVDSGGAGDDEASDEQQSDADAGDATESNDPGASGDSPNDGDGDGSDGANGDDSPTDDDGAAGGQGGKKDSGGKPCPCSGGVGEGACGSAAGAPVEAEDMLDPDLGRDNEAAERMREHVAKDIIEQAKQGRGDYSADVLRWAEKLSTPPKVRWQSVLPRIVRETLYSKAGAGMSSYLYTNRRQAGIGYGNGKPVLPGNRQPVPNVQVWIDTSGSMGTAQLEETLIEVGGLLKNLNGNLTFGVCDAEVHGFKTVRTVEECRKMLKGGGGTDFRPLFDAALKARTKPDTIIVLTDGMATLPPCEPPGIKVLWVLVGQYRVRTMPWGRCLDTEIGK